MGKGHTESREMAEECLDSGKDGEEKEEGRASDTGSVGSQGESGQSSHRDGGIGSGQSSPQDRGKADRQVNSWNQKGEE